MFVQVQASGAVLAQWSQILSGGAGGLGQQPIDYWRLELIGPAGNRLFGGVQLNDDSEGRSYSVTASDPGFAGFVASITDGVSGNIESRRSPINADTGRIAWGIYDADFAESDVLGGGARPDLQGDTITEIRIDVVRSDLINVGNSQSSASYLQGELTFSIHGIPLPEPGAFAALAIAFPLLSRRHRRGRQR